MNLIWNMYMQAQTLKDVSELLIPTNDLLGTYIK